MPLPRRLRTLAAAAAMLALGTALAGCTGDEKDPGAEPTESIPSTPLSEYATDQVVVTRAPFCDNISPTGIEDALGDVPSDSTSYGNGDRARVSTDVRDVAHEFSCTYVADDSTTARAWLFAPPVTPERARDLARDARRERGCQAPARAPAFGQVSMALVCDSDGEVTASYRGLFGDAWLTCSLSARSGGAPEDALVDRTGRWCVQVAEAAAS